MTLQPTVRLFFLASLLFVASCSSSSSPTTPPTNSNVTKPKMNSTFSDSTYTKDTTYANVQSTGKLVTYTLIDTNATYQGYSNVYVFASTTDTVRQRYESNGDVSIYSTFGAGPFTVGSEWVTFPFASQTGANITTLKGFITDQITITGTTQGAGTGSTTVSGQSLSTQMVTMSVDAASASASGGHIPGSVNLSFAPSIGLITHEEITQNGSALGINLKGGTDRFLVAYSLK